MTRRDEVIRMARESGICAVKCADGFFVQGAVSDAALERFADMVAAAERERCAKKCGAIAVDFAKRYGDFNGEDCGAETCADVIRALKDEVIE